MGRIRSIEGERCFLSPIDLQDAEQYAKWLTDFETSVYLKDHTAMNTKAHQTELLKQYLANGDRFWGIVLKETDRLVGSGGLWNIEIEQRSAMFFIYIGDKGLWNGGFGSECTRLILKYGFEVLNLDAIQLTVLDFNRRAVAVYEKCGFQTVGIRRESFVINGNARDVRYMSVNAREYFKVGFTE